MAKKKTGQKISGDPRKRATCAAIEKIKARPSAAELDAAEDWTDELGDEFLAIHKTACPFMAFYAFDIFTLAKIDGEVRLAAYRDALIKKGLSPQEIADVIDFLQQKKLLPLDA